MKQVLSQELDLLQVVFFFGKELDYHSMILLQVTYPNEEIC